MLQSDPATEHAYQALYGSFQLAGRERAIKTLLVTSARPEEGKTTVAVMLALTAAMAGKSVLLVDADLRKPRLHQLLGVENENGLGDLLAGHAAPELVLQAVRSVELRQGPAEAITGRLGVLTHGSTPAAKAVWGLGSPQLKALLDGLAPQFDLVLVDSAPVLAVTDPLFIAPFADAVVMVLAAGVASEKDTKEAQQRIEQAGGTIIGVVMNRFNEKLHGTGVHPYYGSYYAHAAAG